MKVLKNNLLVKELPSEKKIGAILLPDNIERDWCRGEVVLAGLAVEEIKKGDIVIYPPFMLGAGGYPKLDFNGEEHVLISEKTIWAVE